MNTLPSNIPDDELQAGCVLADLSAEELTLWETRAKEQGLAADEALEWIAVQLEIHAAMKATEEIPASLVAALKQQIPHPSPAQPTTVPSPVIAAQFGSTIRTWAGWAAAACFAVLLALQSKKTTDSVVISQNTPATLEQQAKDLTRLTMSGTPGQFKSARGEVLWSNEQQKGFLILTDVPVNNPQQAQYQLWIVDPTRDEIPVDGGVFDIVADASGKAQIEIHAKLAIRDPQAFVITLEQPGGVVRSKQEKVVAIAKR
jgi:anti-sigma-K factor RskA